MKDVTYAKMVSKETGEIFAYFKRDSGYKMSEAMETWITSVFATWTVSDQEFETYGVAFKVAPIIDLTDLAVIALGEIYETYEQHPYKPTKGGPWYWEITRNDNGNH
jgi:hypothetical protein